MAQERDSSLLGSRWFLRWRWSSYWSRLGLRPRIPRTIRLLRSRAATRFIGLNIWIYSRATAFKLATWKVETGDRISLGGKPNWPLPALAADLVQLRVAV